MRHYCLTSDFPDLPARAFNKAFGKNRPATLEGGKGGDSPPPPDPYATAAAQTQTNRDTALYNRYLNLNNFTNPFGSQSTVQIGTGPDGVPIFQTNTSANPQLQGAMNGLFGQIGQSGAINQNALNGLGALTGNVGQIGNQAQSLGGQFSNYAQGALGLSPQYSAINTQLGALGAQLDNGAAKNAQQQGQNAAYQAQTQYLDPQFAQQKESLDAQLANQGITPGSQAYANAMLNFNNQKQQAYSNAANQAIMTGSQIGTQNWQNQLAGLNAQAGLLGQQSSNIGQQSGLYGLAGNLTQGGLGALGAQLSAAQQQSGLYGQQVGIGQTPYSNLQTIAQMIPGYSGPATSAASPADIAGAINNQYQGQLASHNADVASSNQTWQTVGQIGSMAAMAFMMY